MLTFSAKPRRRHFTTRTSSSNAGPGLAPLTREPSSAEPQRLDEPPDTMSPTDPDSVPNRGWHDSSMELRRGLDVLEDLPLDVLPDDVRHRLGTPRRR